MLVACADQLTYGRSRARVQNALSRAGLVRFLDVDGIGVCRITPRGREVAKTGLTAVEVDRRAEIKEKLRSSRAQLEATKLRIRQAELEIKAAEQELAELEAMDGKRLT